MTTCLPVAMIWSGDRVARDDLVLLRQELHREVDALELAARAPAGRAAASRRRESTIGVELARAARRPVTSTPTLTLGLERHALGLHLLHAAVDEVLLHLEVGNAVAQQPADAVGALEDRHRVAGARELLRARQPAGPGADDGDRLARLRCGGTAASPSRP